MAKKGKNFWQRLTFKFRCTVINETTYEEMSSFRISWFRLIMWFVAIALFFVLLTTYLISFTNLKEFIPGFPNVEFKSEVIEMSLRVDSIEEELDKRDRFIHSLHVMIGGDEFDESIADDLTPDGTQRFDTIQFALSAEERDFRSAVEDDGRFSLSFGVKPVAQDYYHFFSPVAGYVTRSFNEKEGHYGTDVVTKQDAPVLAILDGVVIFTDWTIDTGNVVAIQHAGDLISIYKHNSVLFCKQGDYVRTGQVIANVGDTGSVSSGPHLHIEMWRSGHALNPEDFIQFK